jgi:glycosyltransferase involved in cell wall biosynthesis
MNMKRRVLHVVGDSQFGGGAVLILRIAKEAALRGDHVAILSTNPQFQEAIRRIGLEVVDLDCIWREIRPFRDLAGLLRLRRYLRNEHYDIVHTHTSKAGLVGRAASFYAGIPAIFHTVHGFAFHEESSWLAVKCYSLLERLAAKWCSKIVTVSKYHRAWALDLGICKENHIVAIPNGISPERVTPSRERAAFRAELGVGPDEVVLVSAGRLAPQKGIEYLVDAVRMLGAQGVRPRVVLAGDGPMRAAIEQQVRDNGLERQFVFLGFRTDIADILNAGDIAVMPTEREGLSISLLEAMAAGKPIITTTIGSNLEVTENGRFARLITPKNTAQLAEAILATLRDREAAAAIGKQAQAHFYETYTEQVMLDSYMKLYDEFSGQAGRAGKKAG